MEEHNVSQVIETIASIQDSIRDLKEREEYWKEVLRSALALGDYSTGEYQASVQRNRTINKKRALEKYGDAVCSMQWDTAKAKKVLKPEEYEELYDEGKNKIIIKYVGDHEDE